MHIDDIRAGLHGAGWYARADLDSGDIEGILTDILSLVCDSLTSDQMASHVQNWVPLGYDYPHKDPYPNTYEAARAILAETAASLTEPPGQDA